MSYRWVLANDLLPQAAANIKQNVEWNDLGFSAAQPEASTSQQTLNSTEGTAVTLQQSAGPGAKKPKVRVSQGDCW